jgi:hypothetical protein
VNWPRAHWLVGLLTLVVFPLTGAYMLKMAAVPSLDSVPRLIFRSRHLFLLLVAVANLALSNSQPVRVSQRVAAALIMVSPFLLMAAFFTDPRTGLESSQSFHFAMYGLFVAGVLLAIANRPRS